PRSHASLWTALAPAPTKPRRTNRSANDPPHRSRSSSEIRYSLLMNIHPTAIIDPQAKVHPSCKIGPYCTIGANVVLGEGCDLVSHIAIQGPTKIGKDNGIFPFASIGMAPQDLTYKGEPTRLEIGDSNEIREFVTIYRGTVKG